MRHPKSVWTEEDFAEYPLRDLYNTYETWLVTRARRVSVGTKDNYLRYLRGFEQGLERHDQPPILASVTQENVYQWLTDLRETCGEETIGVRLSALKNVHQEVRV
jgi:site-specific recombinase XerD